MLSQTKLKELLEYNPKTGIFIWKVRQKQSKIIVGSVAGNKRKDGVRIKINGTGYPASDLAFLYVNGVFPEGKVYYVDGDCTNIAFDNLFFCGNELTQENLRKLLYYDESTGNLFWNVGRGRTTETGQIAGMINSEGYVRLKVNGKGYTAHRLIWFMTYGVWPDCEVDHINGDRADNRLSNLREVNRQQNQWNRKAQSGLKGASYDTKSGKWIAQLNINGGKKYLGSFDTEQVAHNAYCKAARKLHGEYFCDGTR